MPSLLAVLAAAESMATCDDSLVYCEVLWQFCDGGAGWEQDGPSLTIFPTLT